MLCGSKSLNLFVRLLTEGSGLLYLGGEFLNPRDNLPLLRQRG
jgi:hypothetical protein